MNKYFNKKVHYKDEKFGDLIFDSKKEFHHFLKLRQREIDGDIENLELQKEFLLIPPVKREEYYSITGEKLIHKAERKCIYICDFYYYDKDFNKNVCCDVKGFRTDVYKIKKKLFRYLYKEILFLEI